MLHEKAVNGVKRRRGEKRTWQRRRGEESGGGRGDDCERWDMNIKQLQ